MKSQKLGDGKTEQGPSPLVRKALDLLRPDWLGAWREVADLTAGICTEDPRFPSIVSALDRCDAAFLAGDWPEFQQAARQVRTVVEGKLELRKS